MRIYRFGVVEMSLLFDTVAVANACCCIKGPNCWKSICAAHAGFVRSEFVRNDDDECELVPFSSSLPFVAVRRLIVDGGSVCSLGVGSSSDISEYAGEEGCGNEGGGGVGIFWSFL